MIPSIIDYYLQKPSNYEKNAANNGDKLRLLAIYLFNFFCYIYGGKKNRFSQQNNE